jgi:hypothetical protein
MKVNCRMSVILTGMICLGMAGNLLSSPPADPVAGVPEIVRPRKFDQRQFDNPEAIFWPAYFWLWNGPLDPQLLKSQLQDMAKHETRNVCVVPMPRDFRPDSTANRMDVDYLSPTYFQRVQVAVEEAARLGMHYWLYDEGGWPSGQATGGSCGTVV